jgi:hypothetical protein
MIQIGAFQIPHNIIPTVVQRINIFEKYKEHVMLLKPKMYRAIIPLVIEL